MDVFRSRIQESNLFYAHILIIRILGFRCLILGRAAHLRLRSPREYLELILGTGDLWLISLQQLHQSLDMLRDLHRKLAPGLLGRGATHIVNGLVHVRRAHDLVHAVLAHVLATPARMTQKQQRLDVR